MPYPMSKGQEETLWTSGKECFSNVRKKEGVIGEIDKSL